MNPDKEFSCFKAGYKCKNPRCRREVFPMGGKPKAVCPHCKNAYWLDLEHVWKPLTKKERGIK